MLFRLSFQTRVYSRIGKSFSALELQGMNTCYLRVFKFVLLFFPRKPMDNLKLFGNFLTTFITLELLRKKEASMINVALQ